MIKLSSITSTLEKHYKLLAFFEEEYRQLPEGTLIYRNTENPYGKKYYVSLKENGKMIQRPLGRINDPGHKIAAALKYKRGLAISLRILRNNITILEHLIQGKSIRSHIKFEDFDIFGIEKFLPDWFATDGWSFAGHCYERGVLKHLLSTDIVFFAGKYDDHFKALWQQKCLYPKQKQDFMEYHKENLNVNTGLGFMVRSKSEAMISLQVSSSALLFKYEEPLRLCIKPGFESPTGYLNFNKGILSSIGNEETNLSTNDYNYRDFKFYFPDFTILLPNGKIIFWEHLGRMDKEDYREDNIEKLNIYARNGIYPGLNLFFTYESNDNPLGPDTINEMIKHILCTVSAKP